MVWQSVEGREYGTPLNVLVLDKLGRQPRFNLLDGHGLVTVATLEAASQALVDRPFDAILCVVSGGSPEGIGLPSLMLDLKQRGMLHSMPALIWCGTTESDVGLLASHARVAFAAGLHIHVLPDCASELELDLALRSMKPREPQGFKPQRHVPIKQDLANALVGGDQFRIVLQPQFDLASRRIVGAEALARWHHPSMGEISPSVFVPLAHEAGLDLLLFHLVEARVVALLQDLTKQHSVLPISVNASAATICTDGLSCRLEQRLQNAGVSNSMLKIELTEDMPSQDVLALSTALSRLRMRGFQVSVDDFGCGFASFDLLTRMPFSELKVDRRFVQAMDVDSGCAAAVAASIAMAKAMHLGIVAEGIETEWQIEELLRQGCRFGQGFTLSAPLEVDGFIPLVAGEQGAQSAIVH